MSKLESITIHTSEVRTVFLSVKNYSGVIRKLKGQNVIAIIKLDDGKFMAFIEE